MPGFVIHLLHGKMFLKQANLTLSKMEQKQFQIGLLMPDSDKKSFNNFHFFSSDQEGKIMKVPNLSEFNYRIFIENPFVLGYAAHLYLDKLFFEDYFLKFVNFLDAYGQPTNENNKVKKVFLVKSNKYISIDELFSNEYLYGEYTMLNNYLVKKYAIEIPEYVYFCCPIKEINIENFTYIQRSLNSYLENSSGEIKMNIFTIDSLEKAIEQYAFGFAQWVEGVKSILKLGDYNVKI